MTDPATISAFLAGQIADAETQWSLGTFGAIAEFARDPDEPVELARDDGAISAATARGAVRIDLRPDLRLIAFETTTKASWNQRIALCLPAERCAMNRRAVLTELGPDSGALRAPDRDAVLFDLGIDALQVDVCIRVSDPQVAAQLRAHCGAPALAPGNPAMSVILATSPHRVFISRLGRIEVCQPIPPHNGRSPQGPHTHVLVDLLKHRRTHAATEPIPDGLIPCAYVYPPHPAKDALGEARPFDPARHRAFQGMLRMFGDPDQIALKQRVLAAIAAGETPATVTAHNGRFARTNIRVALRQLRVTGGAPALAAWIAAHEPGRGETN